MKYSHENIKSIIEESGNVFLNDKDDVNGVKTKVKFLCWDCKQESSMNIRSFIKSNRKSCSKCSRKSGQTNSKEYVNSVFVDNGCVLLSDYEYNHLPLNFICRCGVEDKKSFSNFRAYPACKVCSSRSISEKNGRNEEDIKKSVSEVGCTILDLYINPKNRKRYMKYICTNGHSAEGDVYTVVSNKGRCILCWKDMMYKTGEGHFNWKGGYDEQREVFRKRYDYKKWRLDVFKRDGYTCLCCRQRGKVLNAHHIDGYNWSYEKRVDVDNGATLCEDCHDEFHDEFGRGNNTREQFETFCKNKNSVIV